LLTGTLGAARATAAEPKVIISVTSSGGTTICDTDCTTCTVASGECLFVLEEELILCHPLSTGLPITACDWEPLFDGNAPAIQLNSQMRAVEMAPNGNIVFVALTDKTIPGIGTILKTDIGLFVPDDLFKPYLGGGPYTEGAFKLYLNGDLTQQDGTTKPWDALDLLYDGTCEKNIVGSPSVQHTCPVVGSLTAGSGTAGLGGIHFANEDLLRCTPTAFASNGTVEGCEYALMLDANNINGVGSGITSDIEAIDFLSFDPATMTGQMVFKKGSGNPPGFPPHVPSRDLLLYDGTFGSGICSPSGDLCANDSDCPSGEVCETGTCSISGTPCVASGDCTGSGNVCNFVRTPTGTVSLFFDGTAVGLSGSGQTIEGFTILPDVDGDNLPDGADNCPGFDNPPDVCTDGVTACPSGLSVECPLGEYCVQADADGDGVGDPCDQCNGRDDAVCYCGDGILDLPSEQCDLGASNGDVGSPCSAACKLSGHCTVSGGVCTTATDCPLGEGCCGNNVPEVDEDCDDGNVIEDDECDSSCHTVVGGISILGCEGLSGPNVIPAFVKATTVKDTPKVADFDRWKTKGDFNFPAGLAVDADTQDVTIVFNNDPSGLLFSSTLEPADCVPTPCFVQSTSVTKPKWKFLDKEADVPGSPSWQKGVLSQKENKIRDTLVGKNAPLFPSASLDSPPAMRQTLRIGDACITALLACELKGSSGTTLKCASTPTP